MTKRFNFSEFEIYFVLQLISLRISECRALLEECPDPLHSGQFKNVFHRVLYSDSSLDFDFKAAFRGLACVFSDCNAIISFKCMP